MKLMLAAMAAAAAVALSVPAAAAGKCTVFKGTGYGLTDGIARFMATKALTDGAEKWAAGARYKLSPVKLSCGGLSCEGTAKACKL